MSEYPTENREIKHIAFNVYIFFFIIYFLTNSGFAPTYIDVGQLRMEVARSIVENFDLAVPSGIGIQGADGRDYSWFPIGSVLLSLPFYLAAKLFGAAPDKLISIINPIASAATASIVFLFCRRLGHSNRASLLTTAFYGLGTMAWKYSKEPGDHAIETFLVLLSIYFAFTFSKNGKSTNLFLSIFAMGFAILTRSTSILILPILLFMASFETIKADGIKTSKKFIYKIVCLSTVTLIPFILVQLWYNHARFDSIFETGYGLMATRLGVEYFTGTSILKGLAGLLASPGKGLFIYSPITVLFFFHIRQFARKHPIPALTFSYIIIMYIMFYAKYKFWPGDFAWGPRFIFVTIPFFVIPIASLIDSPLGKLGSFARISAWVIIVFSFAIQLVSVSVNSFNYLIHLQSDKGINLLKLSGNGAQSIVVPSPEIYFDWHNSPILVNLMFIQKMASSVSTYKFVELSNEASLVEKLNMDPGMNAFDFWWVRYYYIDNSASWLCIALALIFMLLRYVKKLSRAACMSDSNSTA